MVAAANQAPTLLDIGLTQPPTFDYNKRALSQRHIFNEGGSQGNVETANPSISAGAPTAQAAGASNNNANNNNASHDQNIGGSDENNGGGTGTSAARPPTQNTYNSGGGGFQSAAQQLHCVKLQKNIRCCYFESSVST